MTTYWLLGEKKTSPSLPTQGANLVSNSIPTSMTNANCNRHANNVANNKPKMLNSKATTEISASTPLLQGDSAT